MFDVHLPEDPRKPSWAWSSVDDPNPHYPKCDHCEAFARWSVSRAEGEQHLTGELVFTIRWFACGRHLSQALVQGDWLMDEVHIYDLTYPPERS